MVAAGNGDSNAGGGAGGGINGTGAVSDDSLSSQINILLDHGVMITAGTDPVADPGNISIVASTTIIVADNVSLTTGGLIEGAGVNSTVNVNVGNTIDIGDMTGGVGLESAGVINIGTYTIADTSASSDVSAYGAAAVGAAYATDNVTSTQSINVAAQSSLFGFGNIYITAGQDTRDGWLTATEGDASAEGYVRGLIAVPAANATSTVASNTSVTIADGATIISAQDVILGGYQGAPTASADGTGHGYELGFIPVEDGSDSTSTPSTSVVTMNGTIIAGYYHDSEVDISYGNGVGNVDNGEYQVTTTGAPVTVAFTNDFQPYDDFIQYLTDATVRATLQTGVATGPVDAFELSQLYASGGTITINADSYSGSGSLTAYGSPTISVTNSTAAYLYLTNGAEIPYVAGGQVIFTGLSAATQLGSSSASNTPSITITNSYTGDVGASNYGPALFVTGDIVNLGGLVQLNDATGSYGSSGSVSAQSFGVDIPNGVFAISAAQYFANGTPIATSANLMTWPGGNPSLGEPNAESAIDWVASALFPNDTTSAALNDDLLHIAGAEPPNNRSIVFHTTDDGMCLPYNAHSGGCGPSNYQFANSGDTFFVQVNAEPLTYTSNASPAIDLTDPPKIYGGQIAISANVIDINATITTGQPINQSVELSSSLVAGQIAAANTAYSRGTLSSPDVPLTGLPTVNSGDTVIAAYYDVLTRQIVVDPVNASSGSGYVSLEGGIINTSATLGEIAINGGLGQVDIQNQTGLTLVVGKINTGNTALASQITSTVKIWDTNITSGAPNTTYYVYQPGVGISEYQASNGAAYTAGALLGIIPQNSTTYDPVAGTRFQWVMEASLQRQVDTTTYTVGLWTFVAPAGGSVNNPWVYVNQNNSTSLNPVGYLINQPGEPEFMETVTGSVSHITTYDINYHGCNNGSCNFGFVQTGIDTGNDPDNGQADGVWHYEYPTAASLTVTSSGKADNPIGIDFNVDNVGSIQINSNSSAVLTGAITNANGSLGVTASAGGITQSSFATTLINSATLSASGGIGTTAQPIQLTLTGGKFSASSGAQGIAVDFNSSATIGSVTAGNSSAYGDVSLIATGSLTPAAPGSLTPNVTGRNITLQSVNGAVGAAAAGQTLVVSANPSGGVGGVVNVDAAGDIGLTQVGLNLTIGHVWSTSGDVYLAAPNGAILDAAGQTSASALSTGQLSAIESRLQLVNNTMSLTPSETATIAAYNAQINSDLSSYSALEQVGSAVAGGSVTIDSANLALYTSLDEAAEVAAARSEGLATPVTPPTSAQVLAFVAQIQAQNGVFTLGANAEATIDAYRVAATNALGLSTPASDAQVRTYLDFEYQMAALQLGQAYGSNWQSAAAAQISGGTPFVANGAQQSVLTQGAEWTQRQLLSFIDRSALQPTAAVVGNGVADVSGRDVTLAANSIGQLAPPVTVAASDLLAGNLTSAQLGAIAVATTPGSVSLSGMVNGQTVSGLDLSSLPSGITDLSVSITQTSPLFVSATGQIDATSVGAVFLQGTPSQQSAGATLPIDSINAGGNVELLAPVSIVAAPGSSGSQVVANGNLDLSAGNGSIGSQSAPFTVALGGVLNSAAAGLDVYISAPAGLTIGRVFATGVASLSAGQGDLLASLPGVAVTGTTVDLAAGGDIGAAASAFEIQLAGGLLSGSAGGSAYIYAPTVTGAGVNNLRIGALTAGNKVDLTADAAIEIGVSATATDGAANLNAASLTMDSGATLTAGQSIGIDVSGAAILGRVSVTGNPGAPATVLTIDADAITVNGDAQAGLFANQPDVIAKLTAQTGIGASGAAVSVSLPDLSATTVSGDIWLAALSDLHATNIHAPSGTIDVTGTGSLTLDSVHAGATLSVDGQVALTIGTAQSASDMLLMATGTIGFDQLTATAGDVTATSTDGSITGGSVSANGSARLTAALDNTGDTLTATNGLASLKAGGTIDWSSVTAATSIDAASSGGPVTIGSATAPSITMAAAGAITFNQITSSVAPGTVSLTSTNGAIEGGDVDASGPLTMTAGQDIDFGSFSAASITLQSGAAINGAQLVATDFIDIVAASIVTVGGVAGSGVVTLTSSGDLNLSSLFVNAAVHFLEKN